VIGAEWEFPANVYPWMHVAAARGAEFRQLPVHEGLPSEEELLVWLDDPRVRIVALSWVAFASGYRFDLERIGAACRAKGVYFVVDAIQGVGAVPLDVVGANVDILSCGAQKWLLSPWGAGFVYVRRDLIRELQPHDVSWMAVRGSDDFSRLVQYDLTWRDDARRFEQITLPYQDFAGAAASLGLLRDVGIETIAERVRHHADRIVAFSLANDLPLVTPQNHARRAGIVSVRPPNAASVSDRLKEAGVVHSLREGMIRLSPHFYNTDAEVDRALEVLGETANARSQPTTISR
jgi:selenocysteine lyase/cysteine desulfurase